MDYKVIHQPENNKFVIETEGENCEIEYRINENTINLCRTYVPEQHRGKGLAQILAKEALHYAEQKDYSVKAGCTFVEKYLRRHRL